MGEPSFSPRPSSRALHSAAVEFRAWMVPSRIDEDEGLETVVEDGPQVGLGPAQRLLRSRLRGPGPHRREGPLDGGTDPRQVALEQVVGRARFHAADRRLLVDRAGHDEEGHGRRTLAREGEGAHAVEPGQCEVGEDDVGPEGFQLVEERLPGIHPSRLEGDPGSLELVLDELGVHGHVLQDQDAERIRSHASPLPSDAAGAASER